ncbi:MAG TPA: lecithin retinol acyltransferase family protein [Anaeromyxobacteraceae bacterium]|nr:lecithin retinol acyltransferase family protein [Anaeromyxobacteraceae bacterium]
MRAGDHLRILKGDTWEHAIEVGDRTVIHFGDQGVKRSLLTEFAPNGARIEVVNHRVRVFTPKHVVARAFSRFSDSAYAAMFRDSEAFATWCKTGKMPAVPFTAGTAPLPKARKAARPRPLTAARRKAKAKAATRGAATKSKGRRATSKRPAARRRAKPARTTGTAKKTQPRKALGKAPAKLRKRPVAARPGKQAKRGKSITRRALSSRGRRRR